jgi:hypothetical protein
MGPTGTGEGAGAVKGKDGAARLRKKLVGPMTKLHAGFSRLPLSFTSKTLEKGVRTAPTKLFRKRLL